MEDIWRTKVQTQKRWEEIYSLDRHDGFWRAVPCQANLLAPFRVLVSIILYNIIYFILLFPWSQDFADQNIGMALMVTGRRSIYESGIQTLSRLFAFFPLQLARLHGLSLQLAVSPANRGKSVQRHAAILGVGCSTYPVPARGASLATTQWDSR